MTLCLMVYNFAQTHLRQCLKQNNETLPNQLGKQVLNPTLKWIAQFMNPVAIVTLIINSQKQQIVTNLNAAHEQIIAYFGSFALQLYGLSPDLAPHAAFTYTTKLIHNDKNRLACCET
jgi:hypothetical protein